MSDLVAAIALVQVKRAGEMHMKRTSIAEQYGAELVAHSDLELPTTPSPEAGRHSWHLYSLRVPAGIRDEFIRLMGQKGVGCSMHFKPLHRMSYWSTAATIHSEGFPVTDGEWTRLVSLPIYSGMTQSHVDYVIDAILDVANSLLG